jgi:sugar phosphate permease
VQPTASEGNDARQRQPAYRWVVLAVAWFALLMSFVDRLAWGNVAVVVGRSLSLPIVTLGVFVTAFYIGYVIANALGGVGSDRLGPRIMLACSLIPLGLATFLFSFTASVSWGLTFQALMGLSAGCDYSACIKLMMSWFEQRERGRAMGLLTTANSLGVVIPNAIVPTLMGSVGWQGIYQILGTITAIGGVLVFLMLGRKPPLIAAQSKKSVGWTEMRDLFTDRNLVLLAIAGFWAMWGTWGFTFWANALMVRGHHLSAVEAGVIVSFFGIGAVISKPLVGLLSDWLGGDKKKPLVILCFAGFAASLLVFGLMGSASQFRIVAPFLGVFAFVYTPLMAALIGEAAGVARSGAATGLTNAIWQLGSVIVPSAVGLLYQLTDSFYAAFIALAVGPMLAGLCMLLVREAAAAPDKKPA